MMVRLFSSDGRQLASTKAVYWVLIVDDEPMIITMTRAVLEDAGYGVVAASSGDEAFRVAAQLKQIHVIIVDHGIPPYRGCDIASEVLLTHPKMKVLHMSGWPRETLEEDSAFLAGAFFLAKPFNAFALRDMVIGMTTCG